MVVETHLEYFFKDVFGKSENSFVQPLGYLLGLTAIHIMGVSGGVAGKRLQTVLIGTGLVLVCSLANAVIHDPSNISQEFLAIC